MEKGRRSGAAKREEGESIPGSPYLGDRRGRRVGDVVKCAKETSLEYEVILDLFDW